MNKKKIGREGGMREVRGGKERRGGGGNHIGNG